MRNARASPGATRSRYLRKSARVHRAHASERAKKRPATKAGLKKKRLSLSLTYVFFFFAFFFFGIRLFSSLGRVGAHHGCPNAMSISYVRVAPRIVKQNIEHDGTGAALDAGLEPFAPLGARVTPGPCP